MFPRSRRHRIRGHSDRRASDPASKLLNFRFFVLFDAPPVMWIWIWQNYNYDFELLSTPAVST